MKSKIMQNFRKRAKNAGYTNIHIIRDGNYNSDGEPLYYVTASEALVGSPVRVVGSLTFFLFCFRSSSNISWKYKKYDELGGYPDAKKAVPTTIYK